MTVSTRMGLAAPVLPLLLGFPRRPTPDDGRAHPLFRLLAGFQVALLLVIMANAVARKRRAGSL